MEEAQLQTLHWKTAASAMRYEQRATMSPCQLLRECCRLIHSGETNEFTTARLKYWEAAVYSDTLVSRTIAEGGSAWETLKQRHREVLQQMLDCRIRDSRYARIRTLNRLPDYLSRGHNNNMKLISRFRLGNEERALQRWRSDTRCRICGGDEETLDHISNSCLKGQIGDVWSLLSERGNIKDLKVIIKSRNENHEL